MTKEQMDRASHYELVKEIERLEEQVDTICKDGQDKEKRIDELEATVERLQLDVKQHLSDKQVMNAIIQRDIRTVEQQEIEIIKEQLKVSQQAVLDASHEYQVLSENADGLREAKSSLYQEVERLTRELAEAAHEQTVIQANADGLRQAKNESCDRVSLLTRENAKLREALSLYFECGHHDTCQQVVSRIYECNCGHDMAEAALREEKQ